MSVPPEHLLEDQVRSLRQAVALLGALAVIATGIAVWALITALGTEDQPSARASTVRALENRVDDLEAEVRRAPSAGDLSQLSDAQDELAQDVQRLQRRGTQTTTAIEDLRNDVSDLGEQVDALEQQAGEPTPSPTPEG